LQRVFFFCLSSFNDIQISVILDSLFSALSVYKNSYVLSILQIPFSLIHMYRRFNLTYFLLLCGVKLELSAKCTEWKHRTLQKIYIRFFPARSQFCDVTFEFAMFLCPSVSPSFCYWQQISSHRTDIREIMYSLTLQKSVQNITFSFRYDKNNRHFTWRATCILILSRSVIHGSINFQIC
jgi:hypothetical protein